MDVIIVDDTAYIVPPGWSAWRAACAVNPGLLPDEFEHYPIEVLPEEPEYMEEVK